MARSKYIYVVYDDFEGDCIGTFTVKKEAISFIKMNGYPIDHVSVDVWEDGTGKRTAIVEGEDFLS